MWVVCYTDERGRNFWDKIADDGDLYDFLWREGYIDEQGDVTTDDLMIFRRNSEVDLDVLCYKLHLNYRER
jgi:hypothetical protein